MKWCFTIVEQGHSCPVLRMPCHVKNILPLWSGKQILLSITILREREREREAWGRERRVNTHWSHGLQHPYQSKCHCHHPDQQRFHAHLFLHLQVWSNTDAILSTPPNQPKQSDETVAKIKGKTVDKIKDYTGLYTRAQIRKIYTES